MLHDPLFNKEKIAGLYYIYEIDNQNYISLYIHNRFRQNGNYLKAYKKYGENLPVLTLSECKLESYLSYKRVPYLLIPDSLLFDPDVIDAYGYIYHYYKDKSAKRSGVPYINHINEGLRILEYIGASKEALIGYCVHPLFQVNQDLIQVFKSSHYRRIPDEFIALGLKYRFWANRYLCRPYNDNLTAPEIFVGEPMPEDVKQMLIADKIQNYKDFMIHHRDTHPRGPELEAYFFEWFAYLEINPDQEVELLALIS